jgi:hypothetical protein
MSREGRKIILSNVNSCQVEWQLRASRSHPVRGSEDLNEIMSEYWGNQPKLNALMEDMSARLAKNSQ